MSSYVMKSDLIEVAKLLGPEAKKFSGKTVLITGGHGFLGRYFVECFTHLNDHHLAKPCKVLVLDKFITSNKTTITPHAHVTYVEHDVTQPLTWDKPLHYILHAAGIASPYYYRQYPLETLEVATTGTKLMLQLARERRVEGFLFFSSSEIYGDPDAKHVPTLESYRGNVSCTGPRACYDESKRVGETLCKIFHDQFGVPTKVVRPFNVYGPGMGQHDYRVLPNFASRIVSGQPLHIYADGKQTRTFCYITDAINGFFRALLLGQPGEAYNIGQTGPELSMIGLAKEIESTLKRKVAVDFIEYPDSYPPDEPTRRCADLTKSRHQLRYEPKVKIREGLKRFFEWALKHYTPEK